MKVRMLGHEELARRWGNIVDMVDRSLAHGGGTTDSHILFVQCLASQAQCWVREDEWGIIHGVAITRYEQFDTMKMLAIVCTTSEGWFEHGPSILTDLEEFARHTDCKRMVVYGRKGWVRTLKQYGYEEPYVTLMKEI